MRKVITGRRTHHHKGDLVVFMVGMTIHKPWRVRAWFPVFAAMPKMLEELTADPDSGLLGHRLVFGRGGPLCIRYWSSTEQLYAYASDREGLHRPAWAEFNRRAKKIPGAVGIWHEGCQVAQAESVYVDTPAAGLSEATESVEVGRDQGSARDRLRRIRPAQAGAPGSP
ncbi:hypothetical protein BG28_08095 [Nesterenkonia sp. AN1]|uniref:Uncharacterized protein DUF4188 n=1 Tax=Nesterenkonia aurantiaca TaxID=1436010 RepID=A0A4R7G5I3_9MICC|nr:MULTISPECIES: DUF4188 domain-containing protein [Nesterenkonia]EXF24203.1 hypothetical protein BG28_08095 [Nesterenkonia sp. AN1]TDS86490.1 uncharacterized protein DUF4188 [Nesterenkonia aurantiaca]